MASRVCIATVDAKPNIENIPINDAPKKSHYFRSNRSFEKIGVPNENFGALKKRVTALEHKIVLWLIKSNFAALRWPAIGRL